MATTRTRKRARNDDGEFKPDDPATPDVNEAFEQQPSTGPDLPLDVDSLAAFIGDAAPNRDRLTTALQLATAAAQDFIGQSIGDAAPHPIRQGIFMLAAKLLIINQLETAPAISEIPLVVRAFWKQSV